MSTPSVNVNLRPCNHAAKMHPDHAPYCDANPIPIHLSLQPFRSVTFEVVLGECSCASPSVIAVRAYHGADSHYVSCPARPIRVSCSIAGTTWEESEVADFEDVTPNQTRSMTSAEAERTVSACRERWALVKALVLGKENAAQINAHGIALFKQRDAVFSAIADKARAEQADDATTREVIKLVPRLKARDVSVCTADDYISARALAAYVEHLVEQVSVL